MTSGTSGRALSEEIQPVVSDVLLEGARVLLTEYLCLPLEGTQRSRPWRTEELGEALRNELATLPGPYKAPHGRLTIGLLDGNPVGCAAVSVHQQVAELKRLYVRPNARSRGIGRALVEDAIDWARSAGCRQLRLDVWPKREPAIRLYESLGFQPIGPYERYPFDMVFMGLPLTRNETWETPERAALTASGGVVTETVFGVDDRRVAAVVRLPDSGPSLLPGVVFVDGSGSSDRHEFGQLSRWFLDSGFGVLTYDKAGCGDTPGNWRDQTLGDRVAETRGALEALRAQEAVDSNKVGLWAISQGGWVAPMAAAEDPLVAFMILVSAPGVSPFDQEAASLEQRMRQTGEPEELIERGSSAYWELVERLRSGESPDEVAGWFKSVRNEPLYAHFLPGLFSDPAVVSFFARIGDHDPIPSMSKVKCPVLLIYGERDTLVPVGPSREIIVRQLNATDNHNVTVEIFKGADHNLLVGPPSTGPGDSHPFAPGYGQLMTTWATAQIS